MTTLTSFLASGTASAGAGAGYVSKQNTVSFTASDPFVVPAGVEEVYLTLIGGGGFGAALSASVAVTSSGRICLYDNTGTNGVIMLRSSECRYTDVGKGAGSNLESGHKIIYNYEFDAGNGTSQVKKIGPHPIIYVGANKEYALLRNLVYDNTFNGGYIFGSFNTETLEYSHGPRNSRNTTLTTYFSGRRMVEDPVTGKIYFYLADGYISRADGLATTDTVNDYNTGLVTAAATGCGVDMYNDKGVIISADAIVGTTDAIRNALTRYTTDGGVTWSECSITGGSMSSANNFCGLCFSDDRTVMYIAMYANAAPYGFSIFKSVDFGATWTLAFEVPTTGANSDSSGLADGRARFNGLSCNSDGSVIVFGGITLTDTANPSSTVFYQPDGTLVAELTSPNGTLTDIWYRPELGFWLGTAGTLLHAFDQSGQITAKGGTGLGSDELTSSVAGHLTPSGYIVGGTDPASTSAVELIALHTDISDGKDTIVSGGFGTFYANGGEGGSMVYTAKFGGSRQLVGELTEDAKTTIGAAGLGSIIFPGQDVTSQKTANPGGHTPSTSYQSSYWNGSGFGTGNTTSGMTSGGGGEMLYRQRVTVVPGETLTVTVPTPPGTCMPGIAILEY